MRGKLALLVLVMAVMPAMGAERLTPSSIRADIARHGAAAVVDRLWKSGDYDRIMEKVGEGSDEWLALVPLLGPGADAGAAEDLPIALAYALPNNPRGVLMILRGKNGFSVDEVCGAPFIEPTREQLQNWFARSRKALETMNDKKLQTMKEKCALALALSENPVR